MNAATVVIIVALVAVIGFVAWQAMSPAAGGKPGAPFGGSPTGPRNLSPAPVEGAED